MKDNVDVASNSNEVALLGVLCSIENVVLLPQHLISPKTLLDFK